MKITKMLVDKKSAVTIFGLISMSFVAHVIYTRFYRKKRTEINEVIMFSNGSCNLKKSKHSRCMISESMDRLLYYLSTPRYSIDICMYVITNPDITNAIIKLKFKGIRVRVIMDADMAFSNGSALKKFEKQCIPVRWTKSTNLMHHKFCVIDAVENSTRVPIVILGSMNWTNQALSGNWENVVVTSQTEIVQGFKKEFDRLWSEFKCIVDLVDLA